MGTVEDIENKVREYLDGNYQVIDFNGIPTIDNVGFGKTICKTNMTSFSIDLRKSSQLLFDHYKQTTGKIHKAFLTAIAMTIRKYGGKIRDFQGDSILAFWGAQEKSELQQAVSAALAIKWILSEKLQKYFKKYTELDYGIGIDWGEVYVVRAGIKRNPNNNDLVYIGKSVNFAVAIANQAYIPKCIEISTAIYNNLNKDLKYTSSGVEVWEDGVVEWNDKKYKSKLTACHSTF